MQHDEIFSHFSAKEVVADGYSIFDFLGVKTNTEYKRAWTKHAPAAGETYTPNLPALNEHYPDWILTLESVARASSVYRIAELGAGWGTWSAIAAAAARTRGSIERTEVVAVEADPTHFAWMQQHFAVNGLMSDDVHLLHGAVSAEGGEVRFPVIENPEEDYGASLRTAGDGRDTIAVPAFSIADIAARFSGPIDFVHVDIQGSEYETIPASMDVLKECVKMIMVGTHLSLERHEGMRELFASHGWELRMNYPRMAECETPQGKIQFGDGVLAFFNSRFPPI